MNRLVEHAIGRAPAALTTAALALAALVLASCATAPKGPETKRLVWPPAPQTARVEFVRSLFSEEDLGRDATFNEKVIEFVSGKKPPANRISEPMALALSDDGHRVYVSDYAQLAVFVFDFDKKTFTKIGKDQPFSRPFGIALDASENLYVVEQEKKGITVVDRQGHPVRFITEPSIERPSGIAIDRARGRIYLVDTGHTTSKNHSVKIFDLQGNLVGHIGEGKGTGQGQFLFPTYVTLDAGGNVYVTDTLNSRIQKFDPNGQFLARIGDRGTGWGMFDKPKGAAVDTFGNLYVVDSGWGNVQIFNPKGQVLLFFGGRGQYPGMLLNPAGIAIDAKNRIYVGDYLNHRVEVYQLVNTTAEDSFLSPPPAPNGAPAGKDAAGKGS